ncbi:MAG: oxidoreductase [Planctomycetota bacterium]|nr:oxidoreductase [Planctomycetota bacterium]
MPCLPQRSSAAAVMASVAFLVSGCASWSAAPDPVTPDPAGLRLGAIEQGPSLRGLCAVSADVCWVTGSGPTVALTTDGGASWRDVTPLLITGEDPALDVRDVHARDATRAWVMCAGPGGASRILRTDDGGATWTVEHRETDPASFLDGFDMDATERAVAYGDPLADGRFRVLLRDPATARWRAAPSAPAALSSGEAAFAASGTGIRLDGARTVFVTGANDGTARALISEDRAESWSAATIPIPAPKPASGAFSLALDGEGRGVAVGGDFTARERGGVECAAFTKDGGATWTAPTVGPRGQRAGSCALGDGVFLATGQTGTDISRDGGRTWEAFSDEGFHCVDRAADGSLWFVGHRGRVARLR